MISPNLLTDKLAEGMAMEVILSSCEGAVRERIADSLSKELLDILVAYASEPKRTAFFEKLFKSLDSHERKFASMINGIWEEQRKIIVANLKKMKKAWLEKGKIDEILYPRKQFEQKIAKETKRLLEPIMEERAKEELEKIDRELRKPQKGKQAEGVVGAFDVENPEVQEWLDDYTPKFSNKLEAVSTDKLRRELVEGMKEGEGVPQLTKRINGTYANWNKIRSRDIAQNQAIRASNRGALESYIQSGVVKSKIWITHLDERTCPSCRRLDGKVVGIEENYFNKGDPDEVITVGDTTHTVKNDYEDIATAPRHNKCRCTIGPSLMEIKPAKIDFHKNVNSDELKTIKGWSKSHHIVIRKYLRAGEIEKENMLRTFPWLKKKAEMMQSMFLKYKDGARMKEIYRGLSDVDKTVYDLFKKYKTGDIAQIDKTITSWTQSENILKQFSSASDARGKYNIQLYLQKGRKLTSELDIDKYSHYAEELEILISDTKFKITSMKEIKIGDIKDPDYVLRVYLKETKSTK